MVVKECFSYTVVEIEVITVSCVKVWDLLIAQCDMSQMEVLRVVNEGGYCWSFVNLAVNRQIISFDLLLMC